MSSRETAAEWSIDPAVAERAGNNPRTLTTPHCCLGDGGINDPKEAALHSFPLETTDNPHFPFTSFGRCLRLVSRMTRLNKTGVGLSTQPVAKRSLSPRRILLLSAPTVPTDTTTTSSLPRQRKSEAPSSLPRHTTESLLLLK